MCKQGTRPVLDRVQPTAIGSPPNSFRLREMASVPDSASVPSAERERGIEKTDELRRLKNARNRKFESISLHRRVMCEPVIALPLHRAGGGACLDWACDPGAAA